MPAAAGLLRLQVALQITGISFDGGYGDYLVAPAIALAQVPDDLSAGGGGAADVRGHHHFNALAQQRRARRRPRGGAGPRRLGPSRRAIRGEDGLPDRRHRARPGQGAAGPKLGAQHYIDSQAQDPAAELQKLGGAKVILATVTNGDAMSAVQGGLA